MIDRLLTASSCARHTRRGLEVADTEASVLRRTSMSERCDPPSPLRALASSSQWADCASRHADERPI